MNGREEQEEGKDMGRIDKREVAKYSWAKLKVGLYLSPLLKSKMYLLIIKIQHKMKN